MPVPEITNEQRREYLRRANDLRRVRCGIKARLKRGELKLADVLEMDEAQGMRAVEVIRAVPGVGAKNAEKIMRSCGIAPGRRVRGLGIRQLAALLEAIG